MLNKYPRGYDTIYRKTRALKTTTGMLRRKTAQTVKRFLESIVRQTRNVRSAYELFAWERTLSTTVFKIAKHSKLNAKIRRAVRSKIIACLKSGIRPKGIFNTGKFYHRLFGIFRSLGDYGQGALSAPAVYKYSTKVVGASNSLVC